MNNRIKKKIDKKAGMTASPGFQPGKINILACKTRSFKSYYNLPEPLNMLVSPCSLRDAQVTYELMKSTLQENTNNQEG